MSQPVTVASQEAGALWRVTFGEGAGNVLDARLMAALTGVFRDAGRDPALRAIVLQGQGAHFSYGASVEEHLPGPVADMLAAFRELLLAAADCAVVVLAAVRGRCLGGGLELALSAHRIFAGRDASLGQPEILLGVFPPAASILLPLRVGRAHAEDLCLTGRTLGASEALAVGLVDEIADADPADLATAWARTHLTGKSASSLRMAVRAVRADVTARLRTSLPELERLYLDELMRTADAVEGLRAFLEKRRPRWRHA